MLAYLVGCLETSATAGQVFDIGGPDVLTYKEMMERFAAILGKRRWIFVVPVLTPRLSAYWANLVTPVPASIAFPLIEGLRSETICEDDRIKSLVPVDPIGFDEAVKLALERIRQHEVATRWTNASVPGQGHPRAAFDPGTFPIRDEQTMARAAPSSILFDQVRRVGAIRAGTMLIFSGKFAAGSIGSWAARVCGAAGAIPTGCWSAKPSISGGSKT